MQGDRVIPSYHAECRGLAYFSVSREVGGRFLDMGHIAIGTPPKSGDPLVCEACGAEVRYREGSGYEPVRYRPYADAIRKEHEV